MEKISKHNAIVLRILLFALWAVIAIIMFRADDSYNLKAVLLLLPILFLRGMTFKFSWLDMVVCIVWLYGLTGCLTGINKLQTISGCEYNTVCFIGYWAMRYLSGQEHQLKLFLKGLCILMTVAVLLAISTFFIFHHSVEEAGFDEVYSFRFLFKPLGYTTNAWATALIAILGVGLATVRLFPDSKNTRRLLYFLSGLATCAVLLSFSRGAYIALGGFWILFLIGIRPEAAKWRLLGGTLLIGVVVYSLFPKEMQTTLLMNKTVSQRESNKGRLQTTITVLDVFRQRPLSGAGAGNYTLAIDKNRNQDTTVGYTSYAPNILAEWAIEKGGAGWMVYLFLVLCIGQVCWQRRKNEFVVVVACTLAALFIKEMTLATISSTAFGAFICTLLLGMLQLPDDNETVVIDHRLNGRLRWGILISVVAVGGACRLFMIRHGIYERECRHIVATFRQGDYQEAVRLAGRLENRTPYLFCKAVVNMEGFEHIRDSSYLQQAETFLSDARRQMPADVFVEYLQTRLWRMKGEEEKAFAQLEKLAATYPRNVLYHKDLFHLLYGRGEEQQAVFHLEKAVRLYPGILNMTWMKQLVHEAPGLYECLKTRLLTEYSGVSPADDARYGYILYYCGDKVRAKDFLRKAVGALPNLSTPWYLLAELNQGFQNDTEAEQCRKRYMLLQQGAFWAMNQDERKEWREPEETDLFQGYALKFRDWYKCSFDLLFM